MVVQSLETLSENAHGKARGYLSSIKQFDFIIALCATEHVLTQSPYQICFKERMWILLKQRKKQVGIYIDSNQNWKSQIQYISAKISRGIGVLSNSSLCKFKYINTIILFLNLPFSNLWHTCMG